MGDVKMVSNGQVERVRCDVYVCAREERNAHLEQFAWFEHLARWRARGGEG